MFCFRRMQPVLVSVLTVAVFVVGTLTTEAARKDPELPGNHLVIERVDIDLAAGANGQLTITGNHFDFGNTLMVKLGIFLDLLVIDTATPTQIVAFLPVGPLVGDQLLTVSTGNGQSQNDEYDLTFGQVGPTGATGETGDTGTQVPPELPELRGTQGTLVPQEPRELRGTQGRQGHLGGYPVMKLIPAFLTG